MHEGVAHIVIRFAPYLFPIFILDLKFTSFGLPTEVHPLSCFLQKRVNERFIVHISRGNKAYYVVHLSVVGGPIG